MMGGQLKVIGEQGLRLAGLLQKIYQSSDLEAATGTAGQISGRLTLGGGHYIV
jgi:hypothetical protein